MTGQKIRVPRKTATQAPSRALWGRLGAKTRARGKLPESHVSPLLVNSALDIGIPTPSGVYDEDIIVLELVHVVKSWHAFVFGSSQNLTR